MNKYNIHLKTVKIANFQLKNNKLTFSLGFIEIITLNRFKNCY